MSKKSKLAACVFFFVLALFGGQTNASTVSFTATGFWSDRFHDVIPLIANVTVDASSGVISDASFKMNSSAFGFATFTNIISQGPNAVSPYFNVALQCSSSTACHDTLFVTFSKTPSMAAADLSWAIVSGSVDLMGGFGVNLTTGTALSPVSPVPLPAALPLFATGLASLGLVCWYRKRRMRISLRSI